MTRGQECDDAMRSEEEGVAIRVRPVTDGRLCGCDVCGLCNCKEQELSNVRDALLVAAEGEALE